MRRVGVRFRYRRYTCFPVWSWTQRGRIYLAAVWPALRPGAWAPCWAPPALAAGGGAVASGNPKSMAGSTPALPRLTVTQAHYIFIYLDTIYITGQGVVAMNYRSRRKIDVPCGLWCTV